jgi:hypothetical protein
MIKLLLKKLHFNNVILFNLAKNDTCSEVLKANGNRVAGMIPYMAYMDTWVEYMGWIHDTLL